jgi:hypothetical protein
MSDGGWSPASALDLRTMSLEQVWRTACRVRRGALDGVREPAEPVAA